MLALTRRIGEEIVIDGGIRVRVVAVNGGRVRLGIVAPSTVRVDRAEVGARRAAEANTETADEKNVCATC